MNILVETARASDGPQIGTILTNWIDETDWMPRIHTREGDISHGGWLIEMCDVTVVRRSDQVVGFLARKDDDIHALYVAGDARRQGVGSALLSHAKAEREQLELWTFQANEAAQRFYARHGFDEDKRSDGATNDEKIPDIHFVWQRGTA